LLQRLAVKGAALCPPGRLLWEPREIKKLKRGRAFKLGSEGSPPFAFLMRRLQLDLAKGSARKQTFAGLHNSTKS
jgi:hypothetical protein